VIRNAITRRLAARLARRLPPPRPPDFVIGGDKTPYLRRWYLIPRNRFCNVYLHHVLRDDDDRALHDHPWPSVSLMLAGALGEVYRDRHGSTRSRVFFAGHLVLRDARFAHRLFLFKDRSSPREAWTLFLTGPRLREWGFHCPHGWRHWKEFTAHADTGNSAITGRGCE